MTKGTIEWLPIHKFDRKEGRYFICFFDQYLNDWDYRRAIFISGKWYSYGGVEELHPIYFCHINPPEDTDDAA